MSEQQSIEKEASEWAEQFKTGEWFETIRKEAYIAGASTRLRYIEALKEVLEIADEYVTLEDVRERNVYPYYQKEYEKVKSAIERAKSLIDVK